MGRKAKGHEGDRFEICKSCREVVMSDEDKWSSKSGEGFTPSHERGE